MNLVAEEGKLKKIEEELAKKTESNSSDDSENNSNDESNAFSLNDDDDDDDDEDCNLFCDFIVYSTITIYYTLIGDSKSYKHHTYLTNYPFRKNINNLYGDAGNRLVTPYFDFHYFRHSNQLYGYQIDFKIITNAFIELDFQRLSLSEKLGNGFDHLHFNDFSINLNRFRFNHGNIKWGIGCKYIQGDENYIGFKFVTGLDLYLFKPISVNLDYNVSWINQNPLNDLQIKTKLHYNQIFISVGYKLLLIHQEKIPAGIFGIGVYF
ncbi:MAG: hypothetical protein K8S23_13225 [Candidatus Cloacimonetes bacterium]|nr:hypothetical protein [Candidatus Cloacimonadota bacterium]